MAVAQIARAARGGARPPWRPSSALPARAPRSSGRSSPAVKAKAKKNIARASNAHISPGADENAHAKQHGQGEQCAQTTGRQEEDFAIQDEDEDV